MSDENRPGFFIRDDHGNVHVDRIFVNLTPGPPPFTEADQERARRLFLNSLNASEREEWDHQQTITIRGSDGHMYTIYGGDPSHDTYNVYSHYRGVGMCAYPRGVPKFDILLAQKLFIQTNALEFVQHANLGAWGGPIIPASMPSRLEWVQAHRLP